MLKVSLLYACNTIHKYDLLSTKETTFDFLLEADDGSLRINGYKLSRTDHSLSA